MVNRTWIAVALLVATCAYVRGLDASSRPAPASHLAGLPLQFEGWTGTPEPDFDADTLRVLGVDEYIHRRYSSAADQAGVGLYVGYYASQRQGDAIHSPLNCLPGTGWQAVARTRESIDPGGVRIDVNRLVVERDLDRLLILYWYDARGRSIANEYVNKLMLIADALRFNRTDGALVRVLAPIRTTDEAAHREVVAFLNAAWPRLRTRLPGAP
jgi:EpsI family protein